VQLLGFCGSHVQTSASLDDLWVLLEALEHLEHSGEVGQRHGNDVLAVVDEVGVEVAGPDW